MAFARSNFQTPAPGFSWFGLRSGGSYSTPKTQVSNKADPYAQNAALRSSLGGNDGQGIIGSMDC